MKKSLLLTILALMLQGCRFCLPSELARAEGDLEKHRAQLDELKQDIMHLPELQAQIRELTARRNHLKSRRLPGTHHPTESKR